MKTTIKKILYAGMLGVMLTALSCEKMLEVETPSNLLTSSQVFENVQTANAALSGLYSGLWDNSPLAGDQSGRILGLYADELSFFALSSNTGLMEFHQNTVLDSNPVVSSYWTNAYQKIYQANAILEGTEQSATITAAEKLRIKGEALFIRSLLLLYLQQVYGDIPYPVTTNYVINREISKTPSDEVLMMLESDVEESAAALQDAYRSSERIFVNRKTAQLVLAKIRLLRKNDAGAEMLLKQVIQSPLYAMQNDITKVFDKSSGHILWQLKPRNTGDATKEAVAYYFAGSAPTTVALSPDLVSSFSAADKRKQSWIASVTVGANTWYRSVKYKNLSSNTTEYSVVFRLEEAYLLLAEAMANQDKRSEALPYLNAIRLRAGLTALVLPASKEAMLLEIISENRKEFFLETGHRFFDLKRMDKLSLLQPVKPNFQPFHRVWPLPQKELLLNPKLAPQNPGY